MSLTIKWTPKAVNSYKNTIAFISEKWSQKEVDTFKLKTKHVIELIKVRPKMFKRSKLKNIHIAKISKQTSIFYMVKNNNLIILLFWDNRQNPI